MFFNQIAAFHLLYSVKNIRQIETRNSDIDTFQILITFFLNIYSKGLSTIFIIIIVVAVIIVLGIVGCIVCCVCGCSKRTNGAIIAPAGNQPQVTVVSASGKEDR